MLSARIALCMYINGFGGVVEKTAAQDMTKAINEMRLTFRTFPLISFAINKFAYTRDCVPAVPCKVIKKRMATVCVLFSCSRKCHVTSIAAIMQNSVVTRLLRLICRCMHVVILWSFCGLLADCAISGSRLSESARGNRRATPLMAINSDMAPANSLPAKLAAIGTMHSAIPPLSRFIIPYSSPLVS